MFSNYVESPKVTFNLWCPHSADVAADHLLELYFKSDAAGKLSMSTDSRLIDPYVSGKKNSRIDQFACSRLSAAAKRFESFAKHNAAIYPRVNFGFEIDPDAEIAALKVVKDDSSKEIGTNALLQVFPIVEYKHVGKTMSWTVKRGTEPKFIARAIRDGKIIKEFPINIDGDKRFFNYGEWNPALVSVAQQLYSDPEFYDGNENGLILEMPLEIRNAPSVEEIFHGVFYRGTAFAPSYLKINLNFGPEPAGSLIVTQPRSFFASNLRFNGACQLWGFRWKENGNSFVEKVLPTVSDKASISWTRADQICSTTIRQNRIGQLPTSLDKLKAVGGITRAFLAYQEDEKGIWRAVRGPWALQAASFEEVNKQAISWAEGQPDNSQRETCLQLCPSGGNDMGCEYTFSSSDPVFCEFHELDTTTINE